MPLLVRLHDARGDVLAMLRRDLDGGIVRE